MIQLKLKKEYGKIITAGLAGVFALWFFLTLGKPPEVIDNMKHGVDDLNKGDIAKQEMSAELETKIEELKNNGFLMEFKPASHEAWINIDTWSALDLQEKEEKVRLLSQFLKARDGTSQIVVREYGTDSMVADFFANTLRIH